MPLGFYERPTFVVPATANQNGILTSMEKGKKWT